jgi:glycosyltransferase involved in cell wall biosynthesis
MRIGIFTELYLPHIGGQEVRYAELAASLLQLGHSVDVYCIRHSEAVPATEVMSGVSVFRSPLAENYKRPLFKQLRRAVLPLIRYSIWARRMARRDKYDLLIFNQWPLAHIALSRKSVRDRIVLDWCEVRSGRFYGILMKHLPLLSNRNIAVSQSVANTVADASGCRVEYIPSGVWISNYRCEDKAQRSGIVYLGRVTEHKNLGLLIDAFELIKDDGYGGDLTIAGSGPTLEALTAAGKSSRYSENIHFAGFVDDETKIDILARAEVLVIPSRREGFPRVVAEGMASGLPTVTVDFPDNGTKSVVLDYALGLVADPDARSLSDAIFAVLRNWHTYSENCLKHSVELDWKLLVRKLLN